MTTTATFEPEAVPVSVVCQTLSISRQTASRRIRDGSIRAIHIGPTIRVPVAELRRLIGDEERQP